MEIIEEIRELLPILLEELENRIVDEDSVTYVEHFTAIETIRHFDFVLGELEEDFK